MHDASKRMERDSSSTLNLVSGSTRTRRAVGSNFLSEQTFAFLLVFLAVSDFVLVLVFVLAFVTMTGIPPMALWRIVLLPPTNILFFFILLISEGLDLTTMISSIKPPATSVLPLKIDGYTFSLKPLCGLWFWITDSMRNAKWQEPIPSPRHGSGLMALYTWPFGMNFLILSGRGKTAVPSS